MKELKQIPVIMETDQIIRGLDYVTIKTMDYFNSTIDKKVLDKFIWSLPFYKNLTDDIRLHINDFLYSSEAIFGMRHCDTQEYENRWRIQIQINIQVFPRIIELLLYKKEKSWMVSFAGNNLITLTFSIPKKNEERKDKQNNV